MENTSSLSCRGREEQNGRQNRRGFCSRLLAIVASVLGLLVPMATGIAALLNPLRQKGGGGQFIRLATLDVLPEDGTPYKAPIIAARSDAWTSYPPEPVGAVFLRRAGERVSALQVICPHAGCSISYESTPQGGRFFCPCHAASFDLDGRRTDPSSFSPRDMDTLEVEIRNGKDVWVKYETFRLGTAQKIAQR